MEALRLCEQRGVRVKDVAEELGVSKDLLYRWRSEQKRLGGRAFAGRGTPTSEEAELIALKRELARVRTERDILKKAVGIFSTDPRR